MLNFIINIDPFIVQAESRDEAFERAKAALPGATIKMQFVDGEAELLEFAKYLKNKKKQ